MKSLNEIQEEMHIDNQLNEMDLPGFWDSFVIGSGFEAGRTIIGVAASLLALGGVWAMTKGRDMIIGKVKELIQDSKNKKGAKEAIDYIANQPMLKDITKISSEIYDAQNAKVDKRKKDAEEKIKALKKEVKDLTKKRQEVAKQIAKDVASKKLSNEAIEYLGTKVNYLGTSYFWNLVRDAK